VLSGLGWSRVALGRGVLDRSHALRSLNEGPVLESTAKDREDVQCAVGLFYADVD
jgi:hypothetical protein